jgi:HlyD family secretion protein
MQKPGIKTIIIASVLIIVFIIIISVRGCGKSGGKELIFEKVAKGSVKKTISVTGELDILDPVIILSKTSGVIENVYTDFNQNVSSGQLLLKMDSSSIEQKILKAQGLVESAKFEITSAERDLEGKRNLYKDNLISKKAMEMSEIEYNVVLNKYKQVRIDYDMTVKERDYARIHSPISGIVIAVYAKKNSAVAVSTPLVLLAPTLSKMLLTISIDESDIGYIKNGQQVVFSVSAFPEKKFVGTINQVRINPVKAAGLVTYQSLVLCDNSELLLRPGMTATATVVVEEKKDVLMVLNQAFIVSPDEDADANETKKIVWKKTGLMDGKSYKSVEVKIGLQGDMHTEVTDGLKENDEILVRVKEKK